MISEDEYLFEEDEYFFEEGDLLLTRTSALCLVLKKVVAWKPGFGGITGPEPSAAYSVLINGRKRVIRQVFLRRT